MYLLIVKVFFGIIIALATTYFTIKKTGAFKRYISPIIIVVSTLFTSYVTDIIGIKFSDPKVQIVVNKEKEGEILLCINKKPRTVRTLGVDFPILGKVENIHDFSSNTDKKVVFKRVLGEQLVNSQNNVQISMEDISTSEEVFSFKIIDTPMALKISIPSLDRFCFRYTWEHNGNILEKKKYISIDSNTEVSPPSMLITGFSFEPRAHKLEEVKQNYINGIPVHEFK